MTDRIDPGEGRRLFGLDPEGYDDVRPDYPDWIFESLSRSGALYPGAATLEIGPGPGTATSRLLDLGADPLTLVEPDERFARTLELTTRVAGNRCTIVHQSFEDIEPGAGQFDLVAAATSFHWLDPVPALQKARRILGDDGCLALFWNVFQDLDKPDPFHDATRALLAPLAASPSGAPDTVPFALDRTAREAEARRAGFSDISYEESHWVYEISTAQVSRLYGGFSSIQRLEEDARRALLADLMRIAEVEFNGHVTRNMTSCLYRIS